MDEFYFRRSHVPAFGSWDCYDDMPFTQCFESARQAGMLQYGYSEDRDLYVAGDLYDNDVVKPAMIVVPRRGGKTGGGYSSKGKERRKDAWVVCDCDCEVKTPPGPVSPSPSPPPPPRGPPPKALDEDLYKISPHLIRQHNRRKRSWGFFSSCLQPTCVC